MLRRPPRSTRTYTLFPYTTHFRSKAVLQKEGVQYFVCHKMSDYRAGPIGKDRPVRAGLIGHDNARDDTHAQDNGKYLQPIAKEIGINDSYGFQPQGFQHHQITCKPNRKIRKTAADDVCTGERSEDRRGGKECGSKCRTRWS